MLFLYFSLLFLHFRVNKDYVAKVYVFFRPLKHTKTIPGVKDKKTMKDKDAYDFHSFPPFLSWFLFVSLWMFEKEGLQMKLAGLFAISGYSGKASGRFFGGF